MRGAQSAGELRTRCARLAPVGGVDEVEAVLAALMANGAGPFVVRLPRAAGARDVRYMHLLSGEAAMPAGPAAPDLTTPRPVAGAALAERVAALEAQVEALRAELAALRERFVSGC